MYIKFLNEDGSSHRDPNFKYPLPTADGKPGAWIEAPGERPMDKFSCGPNRLHVCHSPYPCDGARWGTPYEVEIQDVIGRSWGKLACRKLRLLRRIPTRELLYPKADLRWANLRGANLEGINLTGANLTQANLHGVNLRGANLHGANLHGATLEGANLCGANLYLATLEGANLVGTDLSLANLGRAILRRASLRRALLKGAYLVRTDLTGAKLLDTNLEGIDLTRAIISGPLPSDSL